MVSNPVLLLFSIHTDKDLCTQWDQVNPNGAMPAELGSWNHHAKPIGIDLPRCV